METAEWILSGAMLLFWIGAVRLERAHNALLVRLNNVEQQIEDLSRDVQLCKPHRIGDDFEDGHL